MTRTENKIQLNFKIEQSLKQKADEVSKRSGVPVSELLRRGLKFELSKYKRNDIPTLDELMLGEFELFEIHPECRYAVVVKEQLPEEILKRFHEMLKQWLLSGDKFLVINGDVVLVRLDGTEKANE